ncbi:hypothetical protein G7K_0720-t1 [Saitoella complicata NRRL Y-17804]|uniref:Uncharacterized protein n=1 Tax=Saitoella complicata (strain BCRC 22490 / CBS 7301 / JCM 7358 / NBRC 10748 / NRRL Y-17804) TaxID=698492 RepID=A0A0E9N9J0_SAICN|nr:hypothetical protein G7K_0720-t1 [Saitoella complicata NRRL Y-17804]
MTFRLACRPAVRGDSQTAVRYQIPPPYNTQSQGLRAETSARLDLLRNALSRHLREKPHALLAYLLNPIRKRPEP